MAILLGKTYECFRNQTTQKLPCPCGLPAHARYNRNRITGLVQKTPHPTDPDICPDDVRVGLEVGEQDAGRVEADEGDESMKIVLVDEGTRSEERDMQVDSAAPERSVSLIYNDDELVVVSEDMIAVAREVSVVDTASNEEEEQQRGADDDASADDASVDEEESPLPPELDNDVPELSAAPTSTSAEMSLDALAAAKALHFSGIIVDPASRTSICLDCEVPIPYSSMHLHRHSRHRKVALHPEPLLLELLTRAGAHAPRPLLPGPVPRVEGLRVLKGIKCLLQGCPQPSYIYGDRRRYRAHATDAHPDILARYRRTEIVDCHLLGLQRSRRRYIEIVARSDVNRDSALEEVLARARSLGWGAQTTLYQPAANHRERSALMAQTNWERAITGVDLAVIGPLAEPPLPSEVAYCRLRRVARAYYHSIAGNIDAMDVDVLCAIHTSNMYVLHYPITPLALSHPQSQSQVQALPATPVVLHHRQGL